MSFGYLDNVNSLNHTAHYPNFGAQEQPAEKQAPLEKLVNKIDEEKKKKRTKTAIAVGGSVLGLSLFVTILNPRMSSKLIGNLKNIQAKLNQKIERSKGDIAKTKFYKFVSKCADWSSRFLSWTNNINSVKDTYYKQLCTEEKTFFNINNLERRKRFAKYDKVFRKIMKKPHELITKWGDSLAKRTVRGSYKKAGRRMDSFEQLIKEYSQKLPKEKRAEVTEQLAQISKQREYFMPEHLESRLSKQEDIMSNLNARVRKRWKDYRHGFSNKHVKNMEHFNQNLSFWAQDIMEPEKNIIEREGKQAVENLIGNAGSIKGSYRELLEKISADLNPEERTALEKALKKAENSIKTANNNECCNYFDKKRDLVLGSAPTDILTATIGLAAGGISLAAADDRDKRISRLITAVIPAIAGFGTNIALTTMLFSGTKGMLCGSGAGALLSLIGSKVDKLRLAAKNKLPEDELEEETKKVNSN